MKRISSSYVYYYNHKYGRIGHLFQERFKSQPVDEWPYFVTLLRYIHQNPLKARLVSDIAANEELFQSNIVGEPSLADEECYTYIDAGSFEQFPDY